MLTADAVIHGDRERLLGFSPIEHPVALQLGGAEPVKIAEAARIGAAFGYDEINLNIGCPSDRVQAGRFGACLMREPRLVAALWRAAQEAAPRIPVTIKSRIGVDDQPPREALFALVDACAAEGCRTFIVHARKAWLKGLSPKENREVPPLDYGRVYRLKAAHPELDIVINGGVASLDEAEAHLANVDGVALGRAAYQNPYLLAEVDRRLFGEPGALPSRRSVLEAMLPYAERHLAAGGRLNNIARHLLGLYHGRPRARAFRRHLSEQAPRDGADVGVLEEAVRIVEGQRATPLLAAE
jgi:tRNA-dihydrouridine synthase A